MARYRAVKINWTLANDEYISMINGGPMPRVTKEMVETGEFKLVDPDPRAADLLKRLKTGTRGKRDAADGHINFTLRLGDEKVLRGLLNEKLTFSKKNLKAGKINLLDFDVVRVKPKSRPDAKRPAR